MKLLVDADYIVYKSCAGAETDIDWGDDVIMVVSKFSEAMTNVQRELTKIKGHFMWDVPELILFFSDSVNFRKKFCQLQGSSKSKEALWVQTCHQRTV